MMKIGDRVEKISGYKYPGVIVAKFYKFDSTEERFVVECTEPAVSGMLHIFNGSQLKKMKREMAVNPFSLKKWWSWGKKKGTCYDL